MESINSIAVFIDSPDFIMSIIPVASFEYESVIVCFWCGQRIQYR